MSRPRLKPSWPRKMQLRQEAEQLRPHLEEARLELRALYRALDRMLVAQEMPVHLQRIQELDADLAEALYALDRPPSRMDWSAMIDDTRASLARLPAARAAFLGALDASTRTELEERARLTREVLVHHDAYLDIPGRDPDARSW